MTPTLRTWGSGFGLLGLVWLAYTYKPMLGASLAVMLLIGVLFWQYQHQKGIFGGLT